MNKLSNHRYQINDQNVLTHLNIELIKEPANIVALFAKPAYRIVVLEKQGISGARTEKEEKIKEGSNKSI